MLNSSRLYANAYKTTLELYTKAKSEGIVFLDDAKDFTIYKMFNDCEVIEFDRTLLNFINDTTPIENADEMPYNMFFLNNCIISEREEVYGVLVYRLGPEDRIHCVYMKKLLDGRTALALGTVADVGKETIDTDMHTREVITDTHETVSGHMVDNFIHNCLSIINTVDADIKYITRSPSHKRLNPEHRKYDPYARKTTYITVGGELKKYIGEYNKRRETVGHNPSFIVRGHWRHFRSSRFKNKQGQSRWIYPYIKGMPDELVHRFVKVVPWGSGE